MILITKEKDKDKDKSEDLELINCCVTSHKKQNSFDSCLSNIKISEFLAEKSNESYMKTKKITNFNEKETIHSDDRTFASKEIKKRLLKEFNNIIDCFDINNENQINLDELSNKITQKLIVFQKAKEIFNKKFKMILEKKRGNLEISIETPVSLTHSYNRTRKYYERKVCLKHPTFSFSEYNINNLTNFSNSFLEQTE